METVSLLVAGSRNFVDKKRAFEALDEWESSTEASTIIVVSGGAKGADTLGEMWAKERGHLIKRIMPDWNRFGRAAGVMRNTDLVKSCDEAMVFWDRKSSGTADTIRKLVAANKPHNINVV